LICHSPFCSALRLAHHAQPWLLVLMHGVGSNEQDLFSAGAQIPGRFHVLSLRAPHRMGPGSFAWFDFSIEPGGARSIDEAQEAASRALVAQTIGGRGQRSSWAFRPSARWWAASARAASWRCRCC
jgi:predicted esterase